MCIAIAIPKGADLPSREELLRCFNANSHGAGFCYATGEDGLVHAHKGLMTFDIFYKALTDKFPAGAAGLIHFRLGTSGKKTATGSHHPECTHPFPVTNDYNSLFLLDYTFDGPCLVHNGVISGYGRGDMSDTQEFVEYYASGVAKLSEAGDWNKIALLYPDCRIEYHSTQWISDSGRKYSNGGYKTYSYTNPSTYGTSSSYQDDDRELPRYMRKMRDRLSPTGYATSPAWTAKNMRDIGLDILEDRFYVVLADGSYVTVEELAASYEASYYRSSYGRSVTVGVDDKDVVWLCKDYSWPIPCGRLTNKKNKDDRRMVAAMVLDKDNRAKKRLDDEAASCTTVGCGAGAGLPAPHVPAQTTAPVAGTGRLDHGYIPPGGAAAWRGFKVGDRVVVDDPSCFAKNGKAGEISELPDFQPSASRTGGINNVCRVTLDHGGGVYQTTKPRDLRLLSTQITPRAPADLAPGADAAALAEVGAVADAVVTPESVAGDHPVAE